MKEKKSGRIMANVTESEKTEFENVAEKLQQSSAGLAGILIKAYLESREKYGNQVFYPPKFHTFESIKIQEEIEALQEQRDAFEKTG